MHVTVSIQLFTINLYAAFNDDDDDDIAVPQKVDSC